MLPSRCRALFAVLVFWTTISSSLLHAAGTLAQFRTVVGDIEVELMDTDKPVTTANFIRYVQTGAYTNMFLHRCIPGFIVQGGGFLITNSVADTNDFLVYDNVVNYGTITNEYLVGPHVSNTYGTIAMAKVGSDPNSASSQWFFNMANNSTNLDNQNGGFTVFGRVVRGTNVLENFNARQKVNAAGTAVVAKGIVDLRWWFPNNQVAELFSDLPVTYDSSASPNSTPYPDYNTLMFVDVTLLQVKVASVANGREISWNSVSDRVNQVEFTTNFPPTWHSLVSTNGTGARVSVTDTNAAGPSRFYRVRADF
jgi:cyclophilin family peptidyl-prolyl cis-trans isomerase